MSNGNDGQYRQFSKLRLPEHASRESERRDRESSNSTSENPLHNGHRSHSLPLSRPHLQKRPFLYLKAFCTGEPSYSVASSELLLGFDAREMWLDVAEYWPEERKRTFLLRQDIVKPLSTDIFVWRSVFDVEQTLNRPQWTGPIQELWEDLATLQAYLDTAWGERTLPSWIIAVTLQEDGCESEDLLEWYVRVSKGIDETVPGVLPLSGDLLEWYARASMIIPALRDPAWALLGYDVSDKWLWSGLSNCGYGTGNITLWLKSCEPYDRKSTGSSNMAFPPPSYPSPYLYPSNEIV
jgi:hypothetical protein